MAQVNATGKVLARAQRSILTEDRTAPAHITSFDYERVRMNPSSLYDRTLSGNGRDL